MGDFDEDTAVERVGPGRYRGVLRQDWEIWGPMGGYVASLALRAAAAESRFDRPASLFVHYLAVAAFDEVDIAVDAFRTGRSAESIRATMTQHGRPILDATLCTIAEVDGLDHEVTAPPDVPGPEGLANLEELWPDDDRPFPFWKNFEARPIEWRTDWPPPAPEAPVWRQWERFVPRSTFDDPWVDYARVVLLTDLPSWPAGSRPHAWQWTDGQPWIAPSLDLYVSFHQRPTEDPWLLVDGHAPIARHGMIGWNGRLWSSDRRLIATGGGQALCRRVPPPT